MFYHVTTHIYLATSNNILNHFTLFTLDIMAKTAEPVITVVSIPLLAKLTPNSWPCKTYAYHMTI